MGYKLNLTDDEVKQAKGNNFDVLPDGTYGAVVYDIKQEISKSSGSPMYTINYKITSTPGKGRRIRAWYSFQPKALFKLNELNKALGLPVPDKGGEYEIPDPDEYLSEEVNLVIGKRSYETVATDKDVENGVLADENGVVGPEGEPVKEGDPITKFQNEVRKVFPYDEDRHTSAEEDAEERAASGLYLS